MKLTHSQIASLYRALALLLHAGISLADGVFLLREEETGTMQDLLEALGSLMDGGTPLSEAMAQTKAFPACATGMVYVGEQTGRMEAVLESLARFYEQRSQNSRQVRQALTYPGLLLALMLVVIGVLLVQVLPVFDEVYSSLGSHLTGAAAGFLWLGRLLEQSLPVLFWLLAILVAAALLYGCHSDTRRKVNAWFCTRFGDRGVLRKFNNAQFAQALAMALGSGLPLEDALAHAGRLLADVPGARERCERCLLGLRGGKDLSHAMGDAAFLRPAQSRMLAIGLREGSGDRVMEEIARLLMEDAQETLEETVARIEPAMVLASSVLVGLILLSVMLPLMNIMAAMG